MDTEYSEINSSIPKKKCQYCTSILLPGAKVCTNCSRYKNRFFNHFRIDNLGLLITLVMMGFTYNQLRIASENLEETRQKRVEATTALERVEQAEVAMAKLENLINQAQNALSDLRSNTDFNLLLTKANNDDRAAFNRILEISKTLGPFQGLAAVAVTQIAMDVDPVISVRVDPKVPWGQYNIDPNQMSLREFQAHYNLIHPLYRPSYLSEIWKQERFAKGEVLQMLYDVIQNESSLRALHRACILMNQEAKINRNILGAHEYILWWEQNKLRYK